MYTPLEQFTVVNFLNIYNNYFDLSFTKTSLYLLISIFLIFIFTNINKQFLLPNRYNFIVNVIYIEWTKQIKEIIGTNGKNYIVFILSLFLFILSNNLIGMVPYSFTTTSQIIITLTLSLTIFIGVTITGFLLHGIKFLSLFVPSGVPFLILPLLIFIELVSYIFRIISLCVRLTGNIVVGHTILKIISSLGLKLSSLSFILIFFPFIFLSLLFGLEIGVAIIQSFVFSILTTSYIKDALNLH